MNKIIIHNSLTAYADHDSYVEKLMDEIDSSKNLLVDEYIDEEVNENDRGLFQSVLKDITDIEYDVSNSMIEVTFGRGVPVEIMGTQETNFDIGSNQSGSINYRSILMIGNLIKRGWVKLRLSPFVVKFGDGEGVSVTRAYSSFEDKLLMAEPNTNPHDSASCWGGWSYEVLKSLKEHRLEDALIYIYERMKQINIDDIGNRLKPIVKLMYIAYPRGIDIPVEVVAWMIVSHSLRMGDVIFSFADIRKNLKLDIGVAPVDDHQLTLMGAKINFTINELKEKIDFYNELHNENPVSFNDIKL